MSHTIEHILMKKPVQVKVTKTWYSDFTAALANVLHAWGTDPHYYANTLAVRIAMQFYMRLNKPLVGFQKHYSITFKHEEALAILHLHARKSCAGEFTEPEAIAWQNMITQIHKHYC